MTKAKPKAKAAPKAEKGVDTLRVYVYRPILHCPTCNLGMEYVDKADVDPMVCVCNVCKTAVQLPRPTMDVTPVKYPMRDILETAAKINLKYDMEWTGKRG
jgi:hypothetical protein